MKKEIFIAVLLIGLLSFTQQSISQSKWEIKQFTGKIGDFSIFVDGKAIETRVDPFILADQGVTMVPLRDLSEALGFAVTWDEKTGAIDIRSGISTETEFSSNYWVGQSKSKIEAVKVLRNVGPFYSRQSKYQVAGVDFSSGIAVNMEQGTSVAEVILDLNRNYSTLEGFYGVDDTTMNSNRGYILTILGDDRVLLTSEQVKPADYPSQIKAGELDVRYINKLTLRVEVQSITIGDYPELCPVLSDIYFFKK